MRFICWAIVINPLERTIVPTYKHQYWDVCNGRPEVTDQVFAFFPRCAMSDDNDTRGGACEVEVLRCGSPLHSNYRVPKKFQDLLSNLE